MCKVWSSVNISWVAPRHHGKYETTGRPCAGEDYTTLGKCSDAEELLACRVNVNI